MKFELKTENDKSLPNFLRIIFIFALLILLCDYAIKLGIISRHYQIDYKCKLLSVNKSKTNFNKLSKLTNLKSKQRIWEFCSEII